MLQNLLAERFHMTVHREKREQPVYALVVGKNGPKLKKSAEDALPAPPQPGANLPPRKGGMKISTNGHLEASGVTMSGLSDMLSNILDRPVVDKTELPGNYDIVLDVAPEDLVGMKRLAATFGPPPAGKPTGGKAPGEAGPAPEVAPSASVFTAVQQLGLRLEGRKLPVEFIVVDKADKVPTEN
jgi:uncharacterized protein (TIGR03435 family)